MKNYQTTTAKIVSVHGISGINGYREFNKPLELVRTMPGSVEGRSGLT